MALSDVEELLKVRGQQYGNSWKVTGQIIELIGAPALSALVFINYLFPWMMILNKLVRLVFNPVEKDHWMDIAGYATLVMQDIERSTKMKEEVYHVPDNPHV